MAHLGVIKCLEEEGIYPDIVTGTSIGALIGSNYAYGIRFERIAKGARDIIKTDEFQKLGFEFFSDHCKDHHIIGQTTKRLTMESRRATA